MVLLASVAALVSAATLVSAVLLVLGERPLPRSLRRGVPDGGRRLWRLGGIVAGAVAVWATRDVGALGAGVMLAGPVFGLCVLGGVLFGELLARRPAGPVRAAGLQVRRGLDFLPPRAGAATVLMTGALVVMAVGGAVTATRTGDAAGRALQVECPPVTSSSGPFPGWFYSRPALVALVLGLAATLLVLRQIARRPWPASDVPQRDETETLLRNRSAEAALAGYGVLITTMLAGFAAFAGGTAANLRCAAEPALLPAAVMLVVAAFASAWCFVAYAIRLVSPTSWSRS
jgi:hypothetical protein